MSGLETTKLDELFRRLPKNSGIDPRLVEAAKTELNVLKFQAGTQSQTHKQKPWTKSDLDKAKDQLKEKETEILLLKRQLNGSRLSDQHVNVDPNVASRIKERYTQLYDNQWSETYDYFRARGWNEIEIIVTLQRILRASYAFCQDVAKEQLENIEGEAFYPSASWMDDNGILARMKQRQISEEISDRARLYQKTTGQECMPALQKTFIRHVLPTFIDPAKYNDTTLLTYVRSCVEITWHMCIQDPPMVLVDKIDRGSTFDAEQFRKYMNIGSDKFDYLVWPALLFTQAGPLIVKGVAQPIKHSSDDAMTFDAGVSSRHSERENVSRISRNPEDFDDIDDHNSWERGIPAGTPRSAPKVYKREPVRDNDAMPKSPFFDPYSGKKTNKPIPAIHVVDHDTGRSPKGKYAKSDVGRDPGIEENLTVQWKKNKHSRMPSAP